MPKRPSPRSRGWERGRADRSPPPPASIMPSLSPRILGATYARDRGHLWPFALVTGMADAAARAGAEIRIGARVERLARSGDRVTGVVVDGETITCRGRRAGHQRLDTATPARASRRRPGAGARTDPGHPATAAAPGLPLRDELRQGVRAADTWRPDRVRRLSPARCRRGIGDLPRRGHPARRWPASLAA